MAGSNKKHKKIYGGLQYVLEDEEQNKDTDREVEVKWSSRETVDTSNSELE